MHLPSGLDRGKKKKKKTMAAFLKRGYRQIQKNIVVAYGCTFLNTA